MTDIVAITKEEADLLRKKYPGVFIQVTSRQGPARKKERYAESSGRVIRFIRNFRSMYPAGVRRNHR